MQTDYFNSLLVSLSNHSISALPNEACGIITKQFTYVPTKNISTRPKNNFIIDPIAILQNEENIWGFYHSHPYSDNPIPSKNDSISTVFSEYKFVVGFNNKFYIYWLRAPGILEFEVFNESHCSL